MNEPDWAWAERKLLEFERGWRPGRLAECLPGLRGEVGLTDADPTPPKLLGLLAEMVKIDLERRQGISADKPLEDYLAEYPDLAGHAEYRRELIISEWELRRRDDGSATIDPGFHRFPDDAEWLRDRATPDLPASTKPPTDPEDEPLPEAVGRYRVLGRLGRGGMGVVYRAVDDELGRDVAVKMILDARHATETQLARFRQEAQAVARVEHPGVVHVHDVGEHEGLPYLVMEYVGGGSLVDWLDGEPQPARTSAELTATLARAMHAVHDKGVIHRDLKPHNVLLDAAGKPKVADFGLAKLATEDGYRTHTGAILGTPAFMAPEQASADEESIGPPTDVHALGLLLYWMLVGRSPFQAVSVAESLDSVRQLDPIAPGRLRPGVPIDLDTICLKCLRKESARRYASAAELADDLDNFLAGRPIKARPVSALTRAWKWARRHPAMTALAAGAAALLIAVVIVSTVFAFVMRAKNLEISEARDAESRRATEAQRLASFASDALDQIGEELASDPRLKDHGFYELRESLLGKLSAHYEQLTSQRSEDPGIELNRGRAFVRLGKMREELSDPDGASVAYGEAVEIFRRCHQADPEDTRVLTDSCHARQWLAQADMVRGRHDLAVASLAESGRLVDLLAEQGADALTVAELRVGHHMISGNLASTKGEQESAVGHYRSAVDAGGLFSRGVMRREPRQDVTNCYANLTYSLIQLSRPEEAEETARHAVGLAEGLLEDFPDSIDCRADYASILETHGHTLKGLRRFEEALAAYRVALGVRQDIADRFPGVAKFKHGVAFSTLNIGLMEAEGGRAGQATEAFRRGADLMEGLVRDWPNVLVFRRDCGKALSVLASRYNTDRDYDKAAEAATRGFELLKSACEADPANDQARTAAADCAQVLASALGGLRRFDQAHRAARAGLSYTDGATRQKLGLIVNTSSFLAGQQLVPALRLARAGQHAEATASAGALADEPFAIGNTLFNAACVFAICSEKASAADPDLGKKYADRAVELLRRAEADGFFATPQGATTLRTDADLNPLRERPDFRELLESVGGEAGGEG